MTDRTDATAEAMLCRVVLPTMQAMYADLIPAGYSIHWLAEYDPQAHPAPNLLLDKRENPAAKYLAVLVSQTSSIPALGITFTDAIDAAILKIENRTRFLS